MRHMCIGTAKGKAGWAWPKIARREKVGPSAKGIPFACLGVWDVTSLVRCALGNAFAILCVLRYTALVLL